MVNVIKKLFPVVAFVTVLGLYGFSNNNQILNTSLRITVLDILGNKVEGAEINIYGTEKDYRDQTNPIQEKQITDNKGRATFKKLEAAVYFVYITKDDMNNVGSGVQTDSLDAGKLNKATIIIE